MGFRRVALIFALLVSFSIGAAHAQQSTKGGITSIQQEPLKEWLTYIASDELQGRATYSEGLGLAAGYISSHLAQWGVKPAGDHGTYLQVVKVLGVRTTSRATVTVEVNGQTRTFNDGDGITFPREMGGKQTVVADRVQFAGYGLTLPSGTHDDYAKLDPGGKLPRGKVVVWLGPAGPKSSESGLFRLLSSDARNRAAIDKGRVATIAPPGSVSSAAVAAPRQRLEARRHSSRTSGRRRARGRGGAVDDGDFTTVERLRRQGPASRHSGEDVFFEFLFSGSPVEVRRAQGEGGQAGAAAAICSHGRQDHVQRRRRLHDRPHPPHPQRRRHRRGQRSEAEGHLRGLRRPLRPHRVSRGGVGGRTRRQSASQIADGSATSSTTAPTTTDQGRWRSWRSRERSRSDRGRSGRCSSSGTPAKRPGSSDRATTPTIRSCRSTRSSRS